MRWVGKHRSRQLPYNLGDMRSADGSTVYWEVERLAATVALQLAEQAANTAPYKLLTEMLPPEKVALYFEKRIREAILLPIRKLCVAQWRVRNGKSSGRQTISWHDHQGLGPVLQLVWPSMEIPLVVGSVTRPSSMARAWVRRLRRCYRHLKRRSVPKPISDASLIAIPYVEGIDLSRRSELFWYPQSQVDPSRVLIYFDPGNWPSERVIAESVLCQIERLGMRWVCMEHDGMVQRDAPPIWWPTSARHPLLTIFMESVAGTRPVDPFERWIIKATEYLLHEVWYWQSFYESFNIKLHLEIEERGFRNVAQDVALDLIGGIHLGRQRSEDLSGEASEVGAHPDHVFFAWNSRSAADLEAGRNRVGYVIVSGYPNDYLFRQHAEWSRSLRARLVNNGVRFVVALFDEPYNPDGPTSKTIVQDLYTHFLKWALEDEEVGLLIKSKKPKTLEALVEVHGLLARAESTGRCVRLTDVLGRLPSDASHGADMSVGIGVGISTAVVEAIIAGGKGIHWDAGRKLSHWFRKWGYEKVVFDDLGRLMTALKRYKSDPTSEPHFGDHSPVIDQLDPFRDGRAGERVGTYIRWLLEAFDAGHDRDTAIRQANEKYAERWGADKVIRMQDLDAIGAKMVGVLQ